MRACDHERFDRACVLADQAATCGLFGFHAEAAHLWMMAAKEAVTVSGKKACIANAQDELALVRQCVTVH